jgi:hypothetical protein
MWEDPIVKEIHKHRREMLDRFGGDMDALFDYWQAKQEKSSREVVTLPKKTTVEH